MHAVRNRFLVAASILAALLLANSARADAPSETVNPKVSPVTITANVEATLVVTNAREIYIQNRSAVDTWVAFTTGQVSTPTGNYFTIKAGTSFSFPEKTIWTGTLYMSAGSNCTAEVVYFTK